MASSTNSVPEPQRSRDPIIGGLLDPAQRQLMGLPAGGPMSVMIELNLRHGHGTLSTVKDEFLALYRGVVGQGRAQPEQIGEVYLRCDLDPDQVRELVSRDRARAQANPAEGKVIYRVWPDFPMNALIDHSVTTIKADAARRTFNGSGQSITWAVVDSGIDASHPHFQTYDTLGGSAAGLHMDFTGGNSPLTDENYHGTHVAGIIAGGLPDPIPPGLALKIMQHEQDETGQPVLAERQLEPDVRLLGVAPRCKLVSLKVLDGQQNGNASRVMQALEYVRTQVNGNGKLLRIHGVNISLGYEFQPEWFACGQSPLCVEVDRLVRSGVAVVVAAGNTGWGSQSADERYTKTGIGLTINDPGNAMLAITVGSTHRDMPHTYGVSYFSSKGPTGDGRAKPDMVAPGEHITSCAAGQKLAQVWGGQTPPPGAAAYIDDTGTSMAAPHVSGAAAVFMSVHREFIGQPGEIKRILLESATTLGRERYFEGHGLVDLMRAIQSA